MNKDETKAFLIAAVIVPLLTVATVASFHLPETWYEGLLGAEKKTKTVPALVKQETVTEEKIEITVNYHNFKTVYDTANGAEGNIETSTVYIVDTEIPINYDGLNIIETIDFTGEGLIGKSCENEHGVMLANVIGHETIGVNPNVKIVNLKILTCDMETPADPNAMFNAVEWLNFHAEPGDIINLSLSSSEDVSSFAGYAFQNLINSGVEIVSAAGNHPTKNPCINSFGAKQGAHIIGGIQPAGIFRSDYMIVEEFSTGDCVTEYLPAVNIHTFNMDGEKTSADGTSLAAALKTGLLSLR